MNLHKDGHTDQWNKTESPKISPCIYDQLIFDRDSIVPCSTMANAKTVEQEKKNSLFHEDTGTTGYPHVKG